jgi:broad specificity phosphatase PhoE
VTRLFLVRHGNTFEKGQIPVQIGKKSDPPLTPLGCEQAKNIARYFISEKIRPKVICTGTLQRQLKTAQIIQEFLHVETPVFHETALMEIDYGAWEGLTAQKISCQWPYEYMAWTQAGEWPKDIFGKSLQEYLQTIRIWLRQLRKTPLPGDSVIAVTSNGVMRLLYSFLETRWRFLAENRQMEKIKVKTGRFSELLLLEDSVDIITWNKDPVIQIKSEL